jgi:hypothetical protein
MGTAQHLAQQLLPVHHLLLLFLLILIVLQVLCLTPCLLTAAASLPV